MNFLERMNLGFIKIFITDMLEFCKSRNRKLTTQFSTEISARAQVVFVGRLWKRPVEKIFHV